MAILGKQDREATTHSICCRQTDLPWGIGERYNTALPHYIVSLLGYMLQYVGDLESANLDASPILSIIAFLCSELYFECLFW